MRIGSNLFVGGVRELHNPPKFFDMYIIASSGVLGHHFNCGQII